MLFNKFCIRNVKNFRTFFCKKFWLIISPFTHIFIIHRYGGNNIKTADTVFCDYFISQRYGKLAGIWRIFVKFKVFYTACKYTVIFKRRYCFVSSDSVSFIAFLRKFTLTFFTGVVIPVNNFFAVRALYGENYVLQKQHCSFNITVHHAVKIPLIRCIFLYGGYFVPYILPFLDFRQAQAFSLLV